MNFFFPLSPLSSLLLLRYYRTDGTWYLLSPTRININNTILLGIMTIPPSSSSFFLASSLLLQQNKKIIDFNFQQGNLCFTLLISLSVSVRLQFCRRRFQSQRQCKFKFNINLFPVLHSSPSSLWQP